MLRRVEVTEQRPAEYVSVMIGAALRERAYSAVMAATGLGPWPFLIGRIGTRITAPPA